MYLKHKGHDLYILTARPETLHDATQSYVNYTFGPTIFKEVVCVNGHDQSKIIDLAKINPDFYFDDNDKYCEEARLLEIDTYLVSNEHTPWNNNVIHHDITRIKNVCFFPFEKI